jgi:hypothetical protein
MKNIDDKMIEKALRNLKAIRKMKPVIVVLGLIQLVVAGFLIRILYLYIQNPITEHYQIETVYLVSLWILQVAFTLCIGTYLLCSGLFRNSKDIILEHLAEHYLKDKKRPEENSG